MMVTPLLLEVIHSLVMELLVRLARVLVPSVCLVCLLEQLRVVLPLPPFGSTSRSPGFDDAEPGRPADAKPNKEEQTASDKVHGVDSSISGAECHERIGNESRPAKQHRQTYQTAKRFHECSPCICRSLQRITLFVALFGELFSE
jgi:hypothetical protein